MSDRSPTRGIMYVEDAVGGILLAEEQCNDSLPVNLDSSFEISIKELLETIVNLTGFEGKIVWDTSKPKGQLRCKLDTGRAKELIGFKFQAPFEEGLVATIFWYQNAHTCP